MIFDFYTIFIVIPSGVQTAVSVHDAVAVAPAVTETVTGQALYPLRANVTVCDPAETFVSVTGVIAPLCRYPSR